MFCSFCVAEPDVENNLHLISPISADRDDSVIAHEEHYLEGTRKKTSVEQHQFTGSK